MPEKPAKKRAPRNRTLTLTAQERAVFAAELLRPERKLAVGEIENRVIHGDVYQVAPLLPERCVDLLILDPPYNLDKEFNGRKFSAGGDDEYRAYLESWLVLLIPALKPTASIYLCGDWKSSAAAYQALAKYFNIRNRIVWEREKGRGAKDNWKNCTEDIWYATVSSSFYFDVDAVKQLRKVVAPYRENGKPKDWQETAAGKYRLTYPSNFWDDLTVPFWSMPENTDHPTQKPEKLMAKLILASSRPGDLVLDPFLGSGTTAVTAKKLHRRFCGIEIDAEYACCALARLKRAERSPEIQGMCGNVFFERNCRPADLAPAEP